MNDDWLIEAGKEAERSDGAELLRALQKSRDREAAFQEAIATKKASPPAPPPTAPPRKISPFAKLAAVQDFSRAGASPLVEDRPSYSSGGYSNPSDYYRSGVAPRPVPITPERAVDFLSNLVLEAKDSDEARKIAGDFITKITMSLSSAARTVEDRETEV